MRHDQHHVAPVSQSLAGLILSGRRERHGAVNGIAPYLTSDRLPKVPVGHASPVMFRGCR